MMCERGPPEPWWPAAGAAAEVLIHAPHTRRRNPRLSPRDLLSQPLPPAALDPRLVALGPAGPGRLRDGSQRPVPAAAPADARWGLRDGPQRPVQPRFMTRTGGPRRAERETGSPGPAAPARTWPLRARRPPGRAEVRAGLPGGPPSIRRLWSAPRPAP